MTQFFIAYEVEGATYTCRVDAHTFADAERHLLALASTGRVSGEHVCDVPVQEPVAYIHTPSILMEGEVRPVVSFEKYEDDYNSGIYSVRIPLYTHPQPDDTTLLRQALEALYAIIPDVHDWHGEHTNKAHKALAALRERLGEKT